MNKTKLIYCCKCGKEINARLTTGKEIYPHRNDLKKLFYWKCDICKNYVGTHKKRQDGTIPLGVIPSPEIRQARSKIHTILDPLWKNGQIKRGNLYKKLSQKIGKEYHTAEVKSIEEVNNIIDVIQEIKKEMIND
jgi:hypothetical protein